MYSGISGLGGLGGLGALMGLGTSTTTAAPMGGAGDLFGQFGGVDLMGGDAIPSPLVGIDTLNAPGLDVAGQNPFGFAAGGVDLTQPSWQERLGMGFEQAGKMGSLAGGGGGGGYSPQLPRAGQAAAPLESIPMAYVDPLGGLRVL